MDTKTVSASVIGARHQRTARNGQDAAASWASGNAAAIVVCDGCGASASSEVGARLGAELWIAELSLALRAGGDPSSPALWLAVRDRVLAVLAAVVDAIAGDRERAVGELMLFTVVAAAVRADRAGVWAIGDGAYAIDREQHALGPFRDNEPPYVGYELLGARIAPHFVARIAAAGSVIVATDGAHGLALDELVVDRAFAHPDALRRRLVLLARDDERIAWDDRWIARTPAVLQDDCAIAALRWSTR